MDPVRPRILVADDDEVVLALIRDILEPEGCEIVAVRDGSLALLAIDAKTPDLVILDVTMPTVGGLDVAREMRRRPETRTTPVVMISARSGRTAIWEGLDAGCDYYLTKPFDTDELTSVVKRLLAPWDALSAS